jgi:hypothetical protein
MSDEFLFSEDFLWEGKCYLVQVYRAFHTTGRCMHIAQTALGPGDLVISDGRSAEEVLKKQHTVLPVAILSRALL